MTNTIVLPSCPGFVRTLREDPRTPVGNTGHPSHTILWSQTFTGGSLLFLMHASQIGSLSSRNYTSGLVKYCCLDVWLQCHFNNFLLGTQLFADSATQLYHVSIWLCETTLIASLYILMAELSLVWPHPIPQACGHTRQD